MATINYKFADGHSEQIEVTEEFKAKFDKMVKTENQLKERRPGCIFHWNILTNKVIYQAAHPKTEGIDKKNIF